MLDESIYGICVHWKVVKIVYVVFLKQLTSKLKYSGFEKTFEVTHNISADQSPLIVNRTKVTLYGVQPRETYIRVLASLVPRLSTWLHRKYGGRGSEKEREPGTNRSRMRE